ncbi:MAG: hypothetical protein U0167_13955 [bacterium]
MLLRPVRRPDALLAAILLAFAASCSDQGAEPEEAPLAVSAIQGHVRLVGNTFTLSGVGTGTQSVEDADGVTVYLKAPGGALDSTTTSAGDYLFKGLVPGTYRVSTWVVPAAVIESPDVTLGAGRLQIATADTLVVGPLGDMKCSPNPSDPDGFGLEFTMQSQGEATLEILSVRRAVVWSYTGTMATGFNHFHWDGDDLNEEVAPTGAYWAVVEKEGTVAYDLAFWDSGETGPNPGNCGHISAAGYQLLDHGTPLVSAWLGAQGGFIPLQVGAADTLQWVFLRADSTLFAVADTCPENRMTWELADSTVVSLSRDPGAEWTFHLTGLRAGSTTLMLHGWHQDHIHASSAPVPVAVSPPAPGAASRAPGGTARRGRGAGS